MAEAARPAFLGPPRRLELGDAALGAVTAVELPAGVRAPAGDALAWRAGDPAAARLRLARDTPPGAYTAIVQRADGTRTPVTLQVQARARLRLRPGTLHVQGAPGQRVAASLVAENRGNVAVEIPEQAVGGVFADDGLETAFSAAYRLDSDDLDQVARTLFGKLRESHGGLLKLRVTAGAGALAVGERRTLALELELGRSLKGGRGYHGSVPLAGAAVGLRITVIPGGKR